MRQGTLIAFFLRLTLAFYFVDTGALLVVAPWTEWWRHNFFADMVPGLAALMTSPYVQAGVMGTGLITLLVGVGDVRRLLVGSVRSRPPSPPDSRRVA